MRFLGHILIVISLLWASTVMAQETEEEARDRGILTRLIEDNLSTVSRTVTVLGFEGALSSRASVETILIGDRDGVWLRAEGLLLDWDRSALFGRRIDIAELSAERIEILRAPIPDANLPEAEARPFSLPELPVSIEIDTLRAAEVLLGEPLLGEEMRIALDGEVSLIGGDGTADVVARRLDAEGLFTIFARYSNTTEELALDVALSEPEGGLVARVLSIPERPSVDLALQGDGPIRDYQADLSLATAGVERATGTFGFISAEAPDGTEQLDLRADISGDIGPLMPPDYAEFFGPDSRLTVQVQRQATGDVALPILRVDTRSLQLDGSADISPDGWPRRLDLTGRIAARDGTPVLLPLTGPRTFVNEAEIAVTYDAQTDDAWEGAFEVTGFARPELQIETLRLNGGGVIRPTADLLPGQFSANLLFDVEGIGLTDPALAEAVGTEGSGVLTLTRTEEGGIFIDRFTLDGPGLSATADAEIEPPSDGIMTSATLEVSADDLGRFGPLTGLETLGGAAEMSVVARYAPLSGAFDVILSGLADDLVLGVEELDPLLSGDSQVALSVERDETGTRIRALNLIGPEVTVIGSGEITSERTDAFIQLDVSDLGLSLPGLSGPGTLRVLADRQPGMGTNMSLDISAPGLFADAEVDIAPKAEGLGITSDGVIRFDDIAPYAAPAGLMIAGGVELAFNAEGTRAFETFDAKLAGVGRDLSMGDDRIDPLIEGETRLTIDLSREGATRFALNRLELIGDAIRVEAGGRYDQGETDLVLSADLTDLGDIDPRLAGNATLRGRLNRASDGALGADMRLLGPGGLSAGLIAETGSVEGAPVIFEVDAELRDLGPYGALANRDLSGALDLQSEGLASRDFQSVSVGLVAAAQDLGLGDPRLDTLLAGETRVVASLGHDAVSGLTLDSLTVTGEVLSAQASGRVGGNVREGALTATLSDLARADSRLSGEATLTARVRQIDGEGLEATAALAGPGGLRGDATATGPANAPIALDASVTVDDAAPYAGLVGQAIGGALSAETEGTISADFQFLDFAFSAESNGLRTGNAYGDTLLAGSGEVTGRIIRGRDGLIVIDGLAIDYPNLTATAALKGRGTTGSADFDLRLRDVGLFTDELSGPVTAEGSAERDDDGRWLVDTDVTGPGGISAAIDGSVAGRQLNLSIVGQAPLGLANRALEPRRVRGDARFNLRIDGPAALASVSGTVETQGARFAAPTLGRAIEDMSARVRLDGGTAFVDMTGAISGGGQMSINGTVGLTGQQNANLAIRAAGVVLRDPALYETTADAEITLTGPIAGNGLVAGTIRLGEVNVRVPSSGLSTLGPLPTVRHIGATAQIRTTLGRAGLTLDGRIANRDGGNGGGSGLRLDLSILAPDRIFIRGRGLDAELGGILQVGGTTRRAIPSGQFSLLRGRLDILQQRFILDEGSLTLSGDFVPFIRLVASTEAEDGTFVRVIVEGPADSPDITFESQPDLPQDEILARLIFGRDLSQITALQAVQLASAAATLAGRGGAGIVGNIREATGLDDFDITSDEDGNLAVQAGVYLGENVYSDVTVGAERTEIELNLDLTDDLTITGRANSDGETALGIFFERDY